MTNIEFKAFPKIARLNREMIVTEKIDGTNAQIHIDRGADGQWTLKAGSRNRWITEKDDNYGFARWVHENMIELAELGVGRHYGEWWGAGINRGYGLSEKRFSLFNVNRWCRPGTTPIQIPDANPLAPKTYQQIPPGCCDVVPTLYRGPFNTDAIDNIVEILAIDGSIASPGFTDPEGVVVLHVHGNYLFKVTRENDGVPKSTLTIHAEK